MGVNTSRISNKTGRPLYVVIRDGVQLVHRYTTEYRQVPDDGTPITITGLPVGGAIQVAVLYNVFADNKTFVCDLFRVPHQSELVVEVMTQGAGVTSFSGEGVTMVTKGMTIPLELPQGIIEDVKAVAPFVAGALGAKS